jgi:nucleoside-diphosphate-sugar epimerase
MRVFVTGASGHIGSAVVPELLSAGHQVVGLARSDASASALEAAGAEVRRGDLNDLDGLQEGAAAADGVIHLAYDHDWMRTGDFQGAVAGDLRAVKALGAGLEGSGKPFVGTCGTGMLAMAGISDRPGTERDVLDGGPRIDAENHVIGLAEHGVRSSVVRLPPLVHSTLDRHGFAPTLIAIARDRGVSGYVGDGSNRWPAVHTLDAAHLYRLALESAPAGTRLHAVADDGVPFRDIAEVIGRMLGVPTAPVAPEAADEHFAFLARFISMDNPSSGELTRELLDWAPTHPGLIEDLEVGHYFDQPQSRALVS